MAASCPLPGIPAALRLIWLYCTVLSCNLAANSLFSNDKFSSYFRILSHFKEEIRVICQPAILFFFHVSQTQRGTFSFAFSFLSVVIELPEWMGLAGLPWLFTAVQMHLHWGSGGPSHGGSEHTINGLSADAEVCLNTAG